jgi:hypothetical protein
VTVVRRLAQHPAVVAVAGVAWLAVVVVGLWMLMEYDNRPGPAATAPAAWPADSAMARDPAGPTLLMLAHPRCDCTRASLTELAELLARTRTRPRTYVVFIRPGQVPGGWEDTPLWRRAAGMGGVTVVRDDDGAEARRFGVQTSGQVLVYDAAGRLQYSGGTTGSRGKSGNNAGRAAILAALDGGVAPPTSPVFGCPLFAPTDELMASTEHAHDVNHR